MARKYQQHPDFTATDSTSMIILMSFDTFEQHVLLIKFLSLNICLPRYELLICL